MDFTGRRILGIVKHPLFPALAQWIALAVFAALIVIGWSQHAIRGLDVADPLTYTNLATLFFWGIWFIGLVLLVVFVGRLWCTVCPLGYVNDIIARFGLRLRYPRRLRNLFLAAALLLAYTMIVTLLRINSFPDLTARLLLAIAAMVVLIALLFKGRIFCGYLCPVGALVGVYSRCAPWHLAVRDRSVCTSCPSKACYKGTERWYRLKTPFFSLAYPFRRPGCQVDLFPPELTEDPRCVMCTQCIKNCPSDNIYWGSRPFLRGITHAAAPEVSEAVFITILLGLVWGMFTRFWPAFGLALGAPGRAVAGLVSPQGGRGGDLLQILWINALLPLGFTGGLAFLVWAGARSSLTPLAGPPLARSTIRFGLPERDDIAARAARGWEGRRLGVGGIFSAYVLTLLPLTLSGHAVISLVKLNEKVGYLPAALRDPTGVKAYLAMHSLGILTAPEALLPMGVVRWIALGLVLIGTLASLRTLSLLAPRLYPTERPYRVWGMALFGGGIVGLGSLLATLTVKWLFQAG